MHVVRKAADRGHADHGWLKTAHTFSFADYQDPAHMGFRTLRVINDDWVAPGMGFGMHGHRDMEILTYVLEGELAHRDSMGNTSVLRPGELQRMSAGTGVRHSEFNPSGSALLHLYQIWLLPARTGIQPSYEQKFFADADKRGAFRLAASPDGADGSLTIHQDASVYLAMLGVGEAVRHELRHGRHAWLQVLRGRIRFDDADLEPGDGMAISDEDYVTVVGKEPSEVLLFDLA